MINPPRFRYSPTSRRCGPHHRTPVPAAHAELRAHLNTSEHPHGYEQWCGLVEGLDLTGNAPADHALSALPDDTARRLARAALLHWPDERTRENLPHIAGTTDGTVAWLASLGEALNLDPESIGLIMTGPAELEPFRTTLVIPLLFAPTPPDLGDALEELNTHRRATHQQIDRDAPTERAGRLAFIAETVAASHAALARRRLHDHPPRFPATTVRRDGPKVRRNDPCPCGSGRKYKKCHGKPGGARDAVTGCFPFSGRGCSS